MCIRDSFWHFWFKQTKQSFWYSADQAGAVPGAYLARYDSYYTFSPVGPDADRGTYDKSRNADICAVNGLYTDFDCKDFPGGLMAILDHIDSLHPQPPVVIFSGGGFQCIWPAAVPWLCSEPGARNAAKLLQSAWVNMVGADQGAKDLARVLRVPGTWNHKPEYGTPRLSLIHISEPTRPY